MVGAEGLEPPTFSLEGRRETAGQDTDLPESSSSEYRSVRLSAAECYADVMHETMIERLFGPSDGD